MSSAKQPIKLYRYHDVCSRPQTSSCSSADDFQGPVSPNPWKVVIFLYELGLPWEMIPLNRTDPDIRNKEPVVSISPNGRMPCMEDPNTGVKLWEVGHLRCRNTSQSHM
jgi:hypothetical protein